MMKLALMTTATGKEDPELPLLQRIRWLKLPASEIADQMNASINQSNVFIKRFLHQPMSQSAIQKPSLKPQTASNANVEVQWQGKLLKKADTLEDT